jgi:hypothetical protein
MHQQVREPVSNLTTWQTRTCSAAFSRPAAVLLSSSAASCKLHRASRAAVARPHLGRATASCINPGSSCDWRLLRVSGEASSGRSHRSGSHCSGPHCSALYCKGEHSKPAGGVSVVYTTASASCTGRQCTRRSHARCCAWVSAELHVVREWCGIQPMLRL